MVYLIQNSTKHKNFNWAPIFKVNLKLNKSMHTKKIPFGTIGVWGYGIVGKAAVKYLQTTSYTVAICDKRQPTDQEIEYLKKQKIQWYLQENLSSFLQKCDFIIPSPGIDLRQYQEYAHKWLSELDLFARTWKKPIIGVTGTVGKTTITHLLDLIFKKANIPVATGGNIGTGMLSLIDQQKYANYALLELSSWQLEYNKNCAPHIALWTNFSANHLDRHDTLENYFNAKYTITAHQTEQDYTIAPLELMEQLYARSPRSRCIFFCVNMPPQNKITILRQQDTILYYDENCLHSLSLCDTMRSKKLWSTSSLPDYSFTHNWVAIMATLYVLNLPFELIHTIDLSTSQQPHRLEKVTVHNGITFYNDSKSTTIAST